MALLVVRVRGEIHADRPVRETLRRLHLTRAHHATIVPAEPAWLGMLHVVQGYVTWGETGPETVGWLLARRGRSADGRPVAEAFPDRLSEIARNVSERGLPGTRELRPLFRLHPPVGGWESTKKAFGSGGSLGNRGRAIDALVRRMAE